jgi:diguanylate cyclase (GGDEF)-like protein
LVAETVAERFAAMSHSADGERFHATVSIGLAVRGPDASSLSDLLSAADQALYRAKSLGGNRLVHHADLQENGNAQYQGESLEPSSDVS